MKLLKTFPFLPVLGQKIFEAILQLTAWFCVLGKEDCLRSKNKVRTTLSLTLPRHLIKGVFGLRLQQTFSPFRNHRLYIVRWVSHHGGDVHWHLKEIHCIWIIKCMNTCMFLLLNCFITSFPMSTNVPFLFTSGNSTGSWRSTWIFSWLSA